MTHSISSTLHHKNHSYNIYHQRGEYDEGFEHAHSEPIRQIDQQHPHSCSSSTSIAALSQHPLHTMNDVTALYNAGQLAMRQNNDEEAAKYFHDALKLVESASSTSTSSSCLASLVTPILYNIGHIEYKAGRFEEAIEVFTKTLDYATATNRESPHDMLEIASILNCLGVLHFHMSNDEMNGKSNSDRAMYLYREALSIRRAVLGPNHSSTEVATILNNIGRIHYMRGDNELALETYNQAHEMRLQLLGSDHIDTAVCSYNIGQTYHASGKYCEAMVLYKEFLLVARKQLGPHHRDIANMLKCIAQVYHTRKEYTMAKQMYEESLYVARIALGNGNTPTDYYPEIACILNKYGNLLYEANQLDESLEIYKQGLIVERAVLDKYHPNLVITLTNIGQILKLQSRYTDALIYYEEALTIQRQSLGDSHENVAHILSFIALIHYHTKSYNKSLNVYQEALRIRRDVYGDTDLEVASTLTSIGLVLFRMGLHNMAMEAFPLTV